MLPRSIRSIYSSLNDIQLTPLYPLSPFLLALLCFGLCYLEKGYLSPVLAGRWDIGHYERIATHGYEIKSCDPQVPYPAGDLCGNIAWFPAWPLLGALVANIAGENIKVVYHVLPVVLFVFSLLLIQAVRRKGFPACTYLLLPAYFFAIPASHYYLTAFPYAFLMLLQLGYLAFFYEVIKTKLRYWILFAFAFMSALCYPTACLFAIVPVLASLKPLLVRANWTRAVVLEAVRNAFVLGLPFCLGILSFFVYHKLKFGEMTLFFSFQSKYHREGGNPFELIYNKIAEAGPMVPERIAFCWYGLAIVSVLTQFKKHFEYIAYLLVIYLISPSTGTAESVYRHYLLLYPIVFLLLTPSKVAPINWLRLFLIVYGIYVNLKVFFPLYIIGALV